uniref:Lysosome-associated membrane glycoprotein 5 n=1 Tax=Arion vulgaris TaxID=1028688 RepID=A0A0B7AR74_9EUPU
MKIYLLALVFVFAQAKQFNVTENSDVCVLLQLDGTVNLTAAENASLLLDFEEAVVSNSSSCTEIKLRFEKSVEVWFQFNNESENWRVTSIAQFIPHDVFVQLNETEPAVYTSNSLKDTFKKTQSYQCLASTILTFIDSKPNLNITVTAVVSNLKIQSLNGSTFASGESCSADNTTTPAAATTTVATTTVKPTPQPSTFQNFSCVLGDTTKFRVIGNFSLSITYNTTQGKPETYKMNVPPAQTDNETTCSSNTSETLVFKFFKDWSIEYIFKSDTAKKYYISNITLTYGQLPNSSVNTTTTVPFNQVGYLEASTNGYYTCRDISVQLNKDVVLTVKGFYYKAFNEKGGIDFNSGDVTECKADEESSSVVPIAVGAALAGLVVIVLIAYLIGRRRSRKAGYESV